MHGGPSFSGLERSLEELGSFEERWLPFLDVSDVIVVGQRGIGSSKPNTIIETTINFPLDREVTEEEAAVVLKEACAKEKLFWEAQGLDLRGLTVIEAAADVNDVRKALGYEKVIIWGGSFGSHWGMAVMRSYPEIVERAIFRGMEGPNHTYDHPGHLWNVYKRVAAEAEIAQQHFKNSKFIPVIRGSHGAINAAMKASEKFREGIFHFAATGDMSGLPDEVEMPAVNWEIPEVVGKK